MEKHCHSLKILKILECGDPAPLSHGVAVCSREARMKPRASNVKRQSGAGSPHSKISLEINLLRI